jgi:hypothetical protein
MWGLEDFGKDTHCSESCGNAAKKDLYNLVIDPGVFLA